MKIEETEIDVYSRTDVATIGWDRELDAVVLQWHDFAPSNTFREKMNACLELLEEVGGNKLYADARDQGPISDEDKQWSVADWAARADAAGLDYLVIVYPESVIAKMAVDTVIEQVDDGIERNITDDLEGGRHWLRVRPSSATDVTIPPRGSTASNATERTPAQGTPAAAPERIPETSVQTGESEESAAGTTGAVDGDRATGAESESGAPDTDERSVTPAESASTVDVWTVAAAGGLLGLAISVGLTLTESQPITVLESTAMNNVVLLLVLVAAGAGIGGLIASLIDGN